jgi:diacylglycerol kinase (ATP)
MLLAYELRKKIEYAWYNKPMFKRISIIINPAAGQEEPILTYLNTAFHKTAIEWSVFITKKSGDAAQFAKESAESGADVVAVYGGDGTVVEVAQALMHSPTPVAIIPGGTANIMAKELGISTTTQEAIELLKEGNTIKQVDMGLCNGTPFLVRINLGFLAEMITDTDRAMKDRLGQVAYSISAIKTMRQSSLTKYQIEVDQKKIEVEGYALVIANSGNIGLENISFIPEISVTDGLLDLLVVTQLSPGAVVGAVAKTLTQNTPKIYDSWQGKEIIVTVPPEQKALLDDRVYKEVVIKAQIVPKALSIVVPEL